MHGKTLTQDEKAAARFEKYCGFNQKSGDFLLFEQENSTAAFFQEEDVKGIFDEKICSTIDFVVITSCESELVGKRFFDKGVGHVICVKKEFELDDMAAISFSTEFYGQLFSNQKRTICEAYNLARENVKKSNPKEWDNKKMEDEFKKFIMFCHHGDEKCEL